MQRYREQIIQTLRDRQPGGTDPNAIVFDNDMIVDRDFLMAMRGDIRQQRLLGDHFGDDDQYWELWGFVLFTLDVPEESPWRDTDQLGRLEDALVLIREEMERFRTHVMYSRITFAVRFWCPERWTVV
ncbi:hypothetical protein PRZ48_009900 [Zasmidium cellare]|uniref:Uncharacterized protein n=1 Tax=Zasmidium cellare TaxID=395010 RepID=A0ABR0EDQ4_ZASCE|nr:hypothetical protein PRZ48_009900 [Zasmidium cellare]